MDYRKFGIQVESIMEMYSRGDFEVYNSEAYDNYENAEKAVIETIQRYLKKNQFEAQKKML